MFTYAQAVVFFLTVMPLVDAGSINLVPDPCNFDLHLRDQMLQLAQSRAAGIPVELRKDSRMEELMKDDAKRGMMALSRDTMRRQVQRTSPELDQAGVERILDGIEKLKERDPCYEKGFTGGFYREAAANKSHEDVKAFLKDLFHLQ